MKKIAIIIFGVTLVLITGIFINDSSAENLNATNYEYVSKEADHYIFSDLTELEQKSPLIVEAKFSGKRELHQYKEDGKIILTLAKSVIDVKKVHKGNIDKKQITVFEPGWINEDTKQYVTIEGYNSLNEKGRYLLFLKENRDKKVGGYIVVGITQGKYNLDLKISDEMFEGQKITFESLEQYDYLGEDIERFNKFKKSIIEKYK